MNGFNSMAMDPIGLAPSSVVRAADDQSSVFFCSRLRASKIRSSQPAIRFKLIYLCLHGGERIRERMEAGSHARVSYNMCS